jgi:hypothetical protein
MVRGPDSAALMNLTVVPGKFCLDPFWCGTHQAQRPPYLPGPVKGYGDARKYEQDTNAFDQCRHGHKGLRCVPRKMAFCDSIKKDEVVKSPSFVTPVKTGVHNILTILDTGFRRYDGKVDSLTFYETIKKG